jgi:hypothetical protein
MDRQTRTRGRNQCTTSGSPCVPGYGLEPVLFSDLCEFQCCSTASLCHDASDIGRRRTPTSSQHLHFKTQTARKNGGNPSISSGSQQKIAICLRLLSQRDERKNNCMSIRDSRKSPIVYLWTMSCDAQLHCFARTEIRVKNANMFHRRHNPGGDCSNPVHSLMTNAFQTEHIPRH